MRIETNAPLSSLTSFAVGGPAERLIHIESKSDFDELLARWSSFDWQLGYGTNVLISDHGLPGTTVRFAAGAIEQDDTLLIADAGAKWDDLVQFAIEKQLWGLELMSGVPGSVGGAVLINIAAYGQTQSNPLEWVSVYDKKSHLVTKLHAKDLTWGYKQSHFQNHPELVVIQAAYRLSANQTTEITYQSVIDAAEVSKADLTTFAGRRTAIFEARRQADSLFEYGKNYAHTVGSFFRNPMVSREQAEKIILTDEFGKTAEQIKKMNKAHGGDELRVSAAHVMLAAGFKRGQAWGDVRLHPNHVLKIENAGAASAQEIYNVAQEIIVTCQQKLGVNLEPEARILGDFSN